MHEYGFLSVLPPFIAIAMAMWTRQVYVSLGFGLFLGWAILSDGNIFLAFLATVEALVDVFADAGNTRTIIFSALVGGILIYIQRSGGVEGFIRWLTAKLDRLASEGSTKRVWVQLIAWLTGTLIFVESSISVLTVGSLFRPIFDKLKISREKLAYIADSSSAPACILIPFNGWGALIMGLLLVQGFDNPFQIMMYALPYNFYALLTLISVAIVVLMKWDLPAMKRAEIRTSQGTVLWPEAQPMISAEVTEVTTKPGVTPKAFNMLVPLVIMVLTMPVMLIYTGWPEAVMTNEGNTYAATAFAALGKGSGSTAVLIGVITSLMLSMLMYRLQGIFSLRENVDLLFQGISGLMPIALLLLFAFAIGTVCRELQTGTYLAAVAHRWLSPTFIPAILFVISSLIAFSTGTSWGTFAIMIAIAVPMAREMGVPEVIAIAAALGGGIFGDHCSPISDTTILSSMAAATDHIDHVRTQMPYALIVGAISTILYIIVGHIGVT